MQPVRSLSVATLAASALLVAGLASLGLRAEPLQERAGQQASAASPTKRPATWAPNGRRERFTPDNAVFAFVDHQTGLMNLVENVKAVEYKNYVLGLAELAKLHRMPVVLTTSAENGPNGPKLPEILALLPDAPLVSRPGQINAWDNAEFVQAIERTGRRKIIMSGITTDVCVAFATLSALDAGYEVYVVVDASGTMNPEVQQAAIMRMADAGAIVGNWFAIACELLGDWREPAGAGSAELFKKYLPSYAEIVGSHAARGG
jgi:nicotinamidase-related amidase